MKSLSRVIIITILLFSVPTKNSLAQKELVNIRKVLSDQTKGWNDGDLSEYMAGYWQHDSLKFVSAKGITYGYNNVFNNYKKTYYNKEKMGLLTFHILHIDFFNKKNALVTGKWLIQRTNGDKVEGYFTLNMKKIKNKWFIISDHTS